SSPRTSRSTLRTKKGEGSRCFARPSNSQTWSFGSDWFMWDTTRAIRQSFGVSKKSPDVGRVDESLELSDPRGMAHFPQRLGLDLADALAGHLELLAHFLQGAAVAVDQPEALLEDFALAGVESVEDILDAVFQHGHGGHVAGILGTLVLDEIAETGFVVVADGGLEGNGLL